MTREFQKPKREIHISRLETGFSSHLNGRGEFICFIFGSNGRRVRFEKKIIFEFLKRRRYEGGDKRDFR